MNTHKMPIIGLFAVLIALVFAACKQPVDAPPEPAPVHTHIWDWIETKAPTATEAGEETYTCLLCGQTGIKRPVSAAYTPIPFVNISISAPVKDGIPNITANGAGNFTIGAVVWNPNDNPFLGGTEYTATVMLAANSGYTFIGLSSAIINGQSAAVSNNTGAVVTLSYTFPKTDTRTVISIIIKNQPDKLAYTHGDPLDLAGLAVTLTYDDTAVEDVAAANFTAKNITANPAHGIHLVHVTHNDRPVTITYGNLPQLATDNLTVNKAPGNFGTPAAVNATYTPVLTLSNVTLPAGYAWNAPSTALNAGNGQSFAATYTDPSENYESATGAITVNVAKAAGTFGVHAAINITYTPALTLAALNAQLQSGYAWVNPSTALNAGNGQSFAATYTGPDENYESATGAVTVNVAKAAGSFAAHAAINTTYTTTLTLAALNVQLGAGYAWVNPSTALSTGNGQSFAATYTDPGGNYESATGAVTVNVAKAAGIFGVHAAINTTYTTALTLAALNAQLQSGYAWVNPSTALNAGNGQSFAATYTDSSGNYVSAAGTITVNVAKAAGAAVNAPTAATIGAHNITLNAVSASTGQAVEYAGNSTNTAPSTGWQTSATLSGLNAGATYYFFARAAGNNNYETGAASGGTAITTKQNAENEIINYWVDDTGELSVGNGGQGNTVTVQNGGSVTFTANGAGYSNQSWTLNGNTVGSGASYTFDTADNDKEAGRNYIIGLRAQKDGKFYFTEITVKVVE